MSVTATASESYKAACVIIGAASFNYVHNQWINASNGLIKQ